MPYDGLVMAAVARELNERIKGGRIDRVYQPSDTTLVLSVYRHPGKYRLLLSAHARHARIHLTGRGLGNPVVPPMFCQILRKHLEGGRLREIGQRGLERVLTLGVDTCDELGHPSGKTLYCEVMGKHSNLILVDDRTQTIIDGIRRYSHAVSRHREVLPGRPYVGPPAQDKLDPGATEEEFVAAFLTRPLATPLPVLLQQVAEGLSLLTARELVHRAGLDPEAVLDSCGAFELRRLVDVLHELARDAEGFSVPSLQLDPTGRPLDYAAVSLTHCPSRTDGTDMNHVLDEFYAHREEADRLEKEKNALARVVARARDKAVQKIARAGDDPDRGDTYRLFGELLTANLYRLARGETAVVLEDYHGGTPREIPLDPALTPAQNAQRYFRLYAKLQGAARTAQVIRDTAREEKEYLEGIENAIADAAAATDLAEIRTELIRQGYLREEPGRHQSHEKGAPRPLELQSADGLTVWIGRNNLQNDYLTFHLAAPNDIWLHARGLPGAHVVIRTAGRPVPENTLREAAGLAAGFSRGRYDSSVPVDHTRIKYVKKPKGAKPGFVIYERERTVHVAPKRPGD